MTLDPFNLPIGQRPGLKTSPALSWGRIHVFTVHPRPTQVLNKEMEGSNSKEGGSSLVRAMEKMPVGCYSGVAALGKQISSKREMGADSQGEQQVVLQKLIQTNTMYSLHKKITFRRFF